MLFCCTAHGYQPGPRDLERLHPGIGIGRRYERLNVLLAQRWTAARQSALCATPAGDPALTVQMDALRRRYFVRRQRLWDRQLREREDQQAQADNHHQHAST